jgi:plastocyanin
MADRMVYIGHGANIGGRGVSFDGRWTMSTRRAILRTLVGAALGIFLIACGGGDDDSTSPTPAASLSPALPTPQSGVIEVEVKEYSFTPAHFEVEKGKPVTVKAKVNGTTLHTLSVFEDEAGTVAVPGADVAVSPQQSGEFTVTFEEAGTLYFLCGIHRDQMRGQITVR